MMLSSHIQTTRHFLPKFAFLLTSGNGCDIIFMYNNIYFNDEKIKEVIYMKKKNAKKLAIQVIAMVLVALFILGAIGAYVFS